MQNLSKREQSAILALMCRGRHVTIIDAVVPQQVPPHTGYLVPNPEEFSAAYYTSIVGDLAVMPVYEDEGDWATEAPIAQKAGKEWREELELQESGEIVGYWAEGL